MSKSVVSLHDAGPAQGRGLPAPEEIRRQLQAILASPAFHGSRRCQQFLEYVCEKSLQGEIGALKERTLAIEVFGRRPGSDLGDDTIVRVGAREVRKRLAQYYVTPEGAASEIRIDLPLGAYAPVFRYFTSAAGEEPGVEAIPGAQEARASRWKRGLQLATALAVAALVVLAAVRFSGGNPNRAAFQRFWEPVFRDPETLLVAMAHPIVYHPSGRAIRLSEESLPAQDVPLQRPITAPPGKLNGADFVPVFNQYVGFGDMVAAAEVSSMLGRRGKEVRLRLANTVEFADLRRAPTLLIGAVTNRWTMELQQAWRFRFNWIPGTTAVIADTQAGANPRQWAVPAKDDGTAPEDYILVCRIHSSSTGGLLIVAAGLKQFGTEAAGRLLADPEQLGPILRRLPPGWDAKNVQLVLHARVIGNTPAQPEVVATHVW